VNESGASAGISHPTPGELGGRFGWVLLWAWIFMTIPPVALALDPGRSGPSGPILVLPLVCALLTAASLHWRRPWRADASWIPLVWLGVWSSSFLGHRKHVVEDISLVDLDWYARFAVAAMVVVGLGLVAVGLYQHRRHRRLEARLAALGAEPAASQGVTP
jgi:peptidoglycan/LPS O-acetylase OafA/YrhL